ncbi:MAG: hypothetical protein J4F28_03945 [Nitrosopumilaceae archaeon]|nr:hypothetical protein [Nitrosopumilaceae archaeon]
MGALGTAFAMVACRRGMLPWWKAAPVLARGYTVSAGGGIVVGPVCFLIERMPDFARPV